jgi:opacity protein-like surface antigen
MRKLLLAVLLTLGTAAPALAGESPVYAGLLIGPSSIASSSSDAIGIFAGYKLENVRMGQGGTLAVEAQVTSLGSDAWGDNFSSIGADAVALFPIQTAPNLSIFGKLGLNSISGSFSCGNRCSYSSSSGLVFDAGLGIQYKLTHEFSIRAGYQYYDTNFDAVYAAAIYNF